MKIPLSIALAPIFFLTALSPLTAVELVIPGHTGDRPLLSDGSSINASQESIRLGNSNNKMQAGYFPFLLPVLQPNEIIVDAVFSIGHLGRSNNPAGNIDLHGLGVFPSSTPVAIGGFFNGQLPEDDPDATLLVDNFLTSASTSGVSNSTADIEGASSALADYLNSLYVEGVPQDTYLMLRLVIDADSLPNSRYYTVGSANHSDEALRPYLTITTVPEPATTACLIGLAALGLAFVHGHFRGRKK